MQKDHRTLLEWPKSDKFSKSEKCRNCREQRENGLFDLFHQNPSIFQDIYMNFVHIYAWQGSFTYIPVFENSKIPIFWKIYFWLFFKIFKIRGSSLIERFILNLLLKTNCFYLLNCLHDSVSRKPLFLPKNVKTWRHSDVIYDWHIEPSEFSFCQDVSNWWLGEYWTFGDDPYVTSGDIAEKRDGGRGQKIVPPVSHGLIHGLNQFKPDGGFYLPALLWTKL